LVAVADPENQDIEMTNEVKKGSNDEDSSEED